MVIQKDFLNKLKDFGLNSYEAKLWAAILMRGVATAGELSDIANVPRSRSYDVLESLEKKGFVVMKLGKPIKYIAVPPIEVLDRVKKRIQEDAQTQSQLLDEVSKTGVIRELNQLHSKGLDIVDPTDLVGVVKGRKNLYAHLSALIKNAEKSVLILTTEEGFVRKHENLKSALQKAKDKGVKIRIASPTQKQQSNVMKQMGDIAQLKNITGLNSRFIVVDGKTVVFMALEGKDVHPDYDFGVWVAAEQFALNFENLFNKIWE